MAKIIAFFMSILTMTGFFSAGKVAQKNQIAQTTTATAAASASYISTDDAKAAALKRAGLTVSQVTFEKVELERDDRIPEYEVDFYTADTEYDCSVNALTGAITEYETEKRHTASTTKATTTVEATQAVNFIGKEAAKAAALKRAGLTASQVTFEKVELERDDRIPEYEIEFFTGTTEYEIKINALTGAVLEFDAEKIYY